MSLAFTLDIDRPGRRALVARICGLAGALLTGWYVYPRFGWVAGLAVPALFGLHQWWSLTRVAATGSTGRLQVDAQGQADWLASGHFAAVPVRPGAWYVGRTQAWLRLTLAGGSGAKCAELMVSRAAMPARDWRRMQAWIRWRARGGGGH